MQSSSTEKKVFNVTTSPGESLLLRCRAEKNQPNWEKNGTKERIPDCGKTQEVQHFTKIRNLFFTYFLDDKLRFTYIFFQRDSNKIKVLQIVVRIVLFLFCFFFQAMCIKKDEHYWTKMSYIFIKSVSVEHAGSYICSIPPHQTTTVHVQVTS